MMSQLRGVQRLEHKYIYRSSSIEDMEEKVTSCFRESTDKKFVRGNADCRICTGGV